MRALRLIGLLALAGPAWAIVGSNVQPIVTPAQVLFGSPVKTITSTGTVTISTITGTLAVQNIVINGTCTGPGCAAGGGVIPFSLGITTGGPTAFLGPLISTSATTTTILFDSATTLGSLISNNTYFWQANPSSVTLQGNNLALTYLTNSSATATYLQQSSATLTYVNKNQANNGTVTNVTGTAPIIVGNGSTTPAISLNQTIAQTETFTSSVTIPAPQGENVTFGVTAGTFTGNGAAITSLTGANITTNIPSTVLPSTIAYTTVANNFTSSQTISNQTLHTSTVTILSNPSALYDLWVASNVAGTPGTTAHLFVSTTGAVNIPAAGGLTVANAVTASSFTFITGPTVTSQVIQTSTITMVFENANNDFSHSNAGQFEFMNADNSQVKITGGPTFGGGLDIFGDSTTKHSAIELDQGGQNSSGRFAFGHDGFISGNDFWIDGFTTAGNTRMRVYDVDSAALQQVTVGVNGSGGGANRLLRIIDAGVTSDVVPANINSTQTWSAAQTFTQPTTFTSSVTVTAPLGENVVFGLSVGTMTGAGLGTCGDTTHALGFTSTGTFTCQNVTGSGGGGGGSSLAIGLGSTATFTTQISSPTQPLSFDISQFSGQLLGTTTGFITIAYSTNAQTTSYTAVSTDTVVEANCASACTVTLPTAVNRKGKRFNIKMIGVGPVTIATVASQTIDGSTTVTPNPNQYVDIEVESDGSNYDIL
jgi:hypothetical protein